MQIPEAKQQQSETSPEFRALQQKLRLIPSHDTQRAIEKYANKINDAESTQKNIQRESVILRDSVFYNSYNQYNIEIEKIENKFIQTTKFTRETIKDLENVEDCYMEDEKLVVITKEKEFDEYKARDEEWNTNINWKIPSYIIKYEIIDKEQNLFPESLPTELKPNTLKKVLKLNINLANEEEKELQYPIQTILNNERYYPTVGYDGSTITPYCDLSGDYSEDRRENGVSKICYGDSSSLQDEHLSKCDIFPHLYNLLQTLYTTDVTGHGYTTWMKMLIREKIITRTLSLQEKIGNFEGVWEIQHPSAEVIGQKIIFDIGDIVLAKNKKLIDTITKQIEDNSSYTPKEDAQLYIEKILLKPIKTFEENNEIDSLIIKVKIQEKDNENNTTDVLIGLGKEDFKFLTKIKTPKQEFAWKQFNTIIEKNI